MTSLWELFLSWFTAVKPKDRSWCQGLGYCCDRPDHVFGTMWVWELWIWKVVECFKWGLMGDPKGKWKTLLLLIWTLQTWLKRFQRISVCGRDCFGGILVATFCPCLKSMPKDKMKRLILIASTKSERAQERLYSLVKSREEHFKQA